jgi:hypothetical protein
MLRTATALDASSKSTVITTTDLALGHILSTLACAEADALHGILKQGRERLSRSLGKIERPL